MLLPLWLFHWIFLSWWISCPVSKYQKSTRKSWIFDLFHLQVIFDQSPTSEKLNLRICFVVEFLKLNLKSKRVHLPRSLPKKACLSPLRRNEERRGWAVFCHNRKQKEVTEKSKGKRSSNQIKRVKENAWMLKLGEVC